MEQNRDSRNKSMHFQAIDHWQSSQNTHRKRIISSIHSVEKTGYSREEELNWTPISHQSQKLT